ncbi:myelin-oligodendrocyte glycoprotein-like [Trematomus bernacchii]|uniref:myelin-oligodendrocyte glycoprotein-like n=1 Tax=Trematomus bernacchii TaxID=40690 RepID=UPI00146CEF9A|nr:myelin-oligodendrocyte glycoprotein-like [Trematomus bernacchii]
MDCYGLFYSVSPSPVKLRFIFVIWLFSSLAAGQPQVIGSLQPIRAAPGDDIILACHVEPPIDVSGLTVEWSRPDLKPDPKDRLSRVDYVHLYRDRREVTDIKISSYVGRTLLSTAGLGKGDISLNITNVTLEDEGKFRCFIPKLEGQKKFAIVILVVEQNSPTTETPLQPRNLQTPDPKEETADKGVSSRSNAIPVIVFSCLLGILFIGFSVYLGRKHFRKPEVPNMI